MLEVFQALAIRFSYLKGAAVLIALGFAALFAYAALTENAPESLFRSALAGLAWGLLLFTFLAIFPQVPPLPRENQGKLQAFGLHIRRFGYVLLALATVAITIAVIVITFKLL